MKNLLIISASLLILSISAAAQTEIAIQGSYEMPIDEMKWVFKPGQGVTLTLSKMKERRKKRSVIGLNVGFSKFVPKEDIFYYLVNEDELGTIRYKDMLVYQLGLHLRQDFILQEHIELFYGFEMGYYYTKYGYESRDPYIIEDSYNFIGRGAVAARVGVNFPITEHVGAFFQTKYLVSIGPSDDEDNIINVYWNNSAGLNFRF